MVKVLRDGKIVEMKFHPQDYYDEQDELNEVTRYSGFNRNPEDPDSEPFKPTGSVSEFKEDLRALFGKFKGDLRNPEFIRVAQIMVNWIIIILWMKFHFYYFTIFFNTLTIN